MDFINDIDRISRIEENVRLQEAVFKETMANFNWRLVRFEKKMNELKRLVELNLTR